MGIDFGPGSEFITDAQAQAVHTRYPRLRMVTSLVDEIVRHAGRGPRNAPRYTIAGELVRERGQERAPDDDGTGGAGPRGGVSKARGAAARRRADFLTRDGTTRPVLAAKGHT